MKRGEMKEKILKRLAKAKKGMTSRQLAEALGCNRQYVLKVLRNEPAVTSEGKGSPKTEPRYFLM